MQEVSLWHKHINPEFMLFRGKYVMKNGGGWSLLRGGHYQPVPTTVSQSLLHCLSM